MAYPSFNSGDVLNASDMNAVGLWKIQTDTITNLSTKSYTGVFTSDFTNYKILIKPTSFGSFDLRMRLRNASGDDQTANYFFGSPRIDQAGGADNRNGNTLTYWTVIISASGFSNFLMCDFTIGSPQKNTETVMAGTTTWNSGAGFSSGAYGALHNTAFQATGFTVYSSTGGNFSAFVQIFGIRD